MHEYVKVCHRFLCVQAKSEVQKLIVKAQDGALEAQPGRTIMESFEGQVSLQSNSLTVLDSAALTEGLLHCTYICRSICAFLCLWVYLHRTVANCATLRLERNFCVSAGQPGVE